MKNGKKKNEKLPMPQGNVISGCNFNSTIWDGQALESVRIVATALLNLTELFKSQNIRIESLLTIKDK